jgi:uncharacterized protein YndB with AHSA1/START domain
MGPVSAEIEIDLPRERVYEEIADLALRQRFTDHFQHGFHLTRIDSSGVGAGARFCSGSRLRSTWMDSVIEELDPPHRIVERGRGGRANRIPQTTAWELTDGPGGLTRVRVSHWTEPKHPLDRLVEPLSGLAGAERRGWRVALRRLRDELESAAAPAERVSVAGSNRHLTGIP